MLATYVNVALLPPNDEYMPNKCIIISSSSIAVVVIVIITFIIVIYKTFSHFFLF